MYQSNIGSLITSEFFCDRYPNMHPWGTNFMGPWIKITAFRVLRQTTNVLGGGISRIFEGDSFDFLPTGDIAQNVGHDWEEYESIASRVAQKISSIGKATQEVAGLGKTGKDAIKKILSGESAVSTIKGLPKGIQSDIKQYKVDMPLIYKNTERQVYNFSVTLVSHRGKQQREVLAPVKRLIELSYPSYKRDSIEIEPPFIFDVKVGKIASLRNVALIAVQPTYKGPYVYGNPSVCEMELTFKDTQHKYRNPESKKVSTSSTMNKIHKVLGMK